MIDTSDSKDRPHEKLDELTDEALLPGSPEFWRLGNLGFRVLLNPKPQTLNLKPQTLNPRIKGLGLGAWGL